MGKVIHQCGAETERIGPFGLCRQTATGADHRPATVLLNNGSAEPIRNFLFRRFETGSFQLVKIAVKRSNGKLFLIGRCRKIGICKPDTDGLDEGEGG
jgi:hypothetical protein